MSTMIRPLAYTRRHPNLADLPLTTLKRKFLISGPEKVGKSRLIQRIYDDVAKVEYEKTPHWFKKDLRKGSETFGKE